MKIRKRRVWLLVPSIIVAILGLSALGATIWYKQMLSPFDVRAQQTVKKAWVLVILLKFWRIRRLSRIH